MTLAARIHYSIILFISVISSCSGQSCVLGPQAEGAQSVAECLIPQQASPLEEEDGMSLLQYKNKKVESGDRRSTKVEMHSNGLHEKQRKQEKEEEQEEQQEEQQEELKPMQWEDGQVKVVYGVFTSPQEKYAQQLDAVLHTWAQDVAPGKLLVVGVKGTNPNVTYRLAPLCKDGHVNNDGISCKEATLLTEGYASQADWVVIVGSDNYVFPRNFEAELKKSDPTVAQIRAIWGCGAGLYCEDKQGGLCGGGGYAISRAALDKMIGKDEGAAKSFIQESMNTAATVCGYWSDQVTSCIARRRHVEQIPQVGLYGWRVCGEAQSCDFDLKGNEYEKLIKAQNPPTLTFHYVVPQEMYKIHEMKQRYQAEGPPALLQIDSTEDQKVATEYEQHRLAYVSHMNSVMNRSNLSSN